MAGTTAIEYDDGYQGRIAAVPGHHCADHARGKIPVLFLIRFHLPLIYFIMDLKYSTQL